MNYIAQLYITAFLRNSYQTIIRRNNFPIDPINPSPPLPTLPPPPHKKAINRVKKRFDGLVQFCHEIKIFKEHMRLLWYTITLQKNYWNISIG